MMRVCFQAAGCLERVRDLSVCLLTHLLDDSDWLLLFDQSGSGVNAWRCSYVFVCCCRRYVTGVMFLLF